MSQALQDQYAAKSTCYGCGPTNEKGMRIKSFPAADGETVTARFKPEPHHQAFAGAVNGGVIATLLDCHSNWTERGHSCAGRRRTLRPVPSPGNFT